VLLSPRPFLSRPEPKAAVLQPTIFGSVDPKMPPTPIPLPPPPPPQPINIKPLPYQLPAHLNIRLITDNGLPPPPPPPQPITIGPAPPSPNGREGGPVGGRSPESRRGGSPTPSKTDAFYKPWDRFTHRRARTKSQNAGCKSSKNVDTVPSLERDVEGRPGRVVVENEDGVESREKAATSYEEAAAICKQKVEAIVRECKRLNQKFYDRMFNLPDFDTLASLGAEEDPQSISSLVGVGAVKRIEVN
jgi:hypothetical protein